jgi:hypothetical protein
MSVIRGNPEDMCSGRVFRILTQTGSRLARGTPQNVGRSEPTSAAIERSRIRDPFKEPAGASTPRPRNAPKRLLERIRDCRLSKVALSIVQKSRNSHTFGASGSGRWTRGDRRPSAAAHGTSIGLTPKQYRSGPQLTIAQNLRELLRASTRVGPYTRRRVQWCLRSVATETCGQLKPLKFSRTVCVY